MRSTLSVQKSEVVTGGGMVTALHPLAAEAGAAVLRDGGNAVDAAVTMAFALAVVEPCMSGLGGGGAMVVYAPDAGVQCTIDHNMRAPLSASPAMFDLTPDAAPRGFYGWPAVRDDANIVGYQSMAVPGSVAGLCLGLERFGTIDLDQALRPAIALAEDGFPVDWALALHLTAAAREMHRFPGTTDIFFRDGFPLISEGADGPDHLRQRDLARTLTLLARHGPDVFYHGEIAERICSAMTANGGLVKARDLAEYVPLMEKHGALPSYRGHPIVGVLKGSGSTTTLEMLKILEQFPMAEFGHNSAAAARILAEVFNRGFVDRFSLIDNADPANVPTERIWSQDYAERMAAEIRRSEYLPDLKVPAAAPKRPGHTTHLSAVDRGRTSVALTQTLLSLFGSMVVIPETWIIMNNGMMWFDPRPGQANSIEGGKRCLSAISPLILLDREQSLPYLVVGASGGRKIITAVAQVISNVIDHGMGVQDAVAAARVHRELGEILIDSRLGARLAPPLIDQGYQVLVQEETYASGHFALVSAIGFQRDTGTLHSGVEPLKYGMAIGV
ncbi:MAG: gamma-glutamyltransferase [Chloroflexota bacterium]